MQTGISEPHIVGEGGMQTGISEPHIVGGGMQTGISETQLPLVWWPSGLRC